MFARGFGVANTASQSHRAAKSKEPGPALAGFLLSCANQKQSIVVMMTVLLNDHVGHSDCASHSDARGSTHDEDRDRDARIF
jgi:hypothetical protein